MKSALMHRVIHLLTIGCMGLMGICISVLYPGSLKAGTNGYYFPYAYLWTETVVPVEDGLFLTLNAGHKLSFVTLKEDEYVETWNSDSIGLSAWQFIGKLIAVEGNLIYIAYLDLDNRAAGIVLEKNGDSLTQAGTLDMSTIRGEEFFDRISMGSLEVSDSNLFLHGYADNPVCVTFARDGNVWKTTDEVNLNYQPDDSTRQLAGVTGSGLEQSFLMLRMNGYNDVTGLSSYFLEVYQRNPAEWQVVQTIEFEASAPNNNFSTVFNPERNHFLILGGAYEAEEIHEFKFIDNQWNYLGDLEIQGIDFSTTDVFEPVSNGESFLLRTSSDEMHLFRYVENDWMNVASRHEPVWTGGSAYQHTVLTDDHVIAFNPFADYSYPESMLVALYSADDLTPTSRPWFESATYFPDGLAWLPNLGYYFPEVSIYPTGTWIYSFELGWLYVNSKDPDSFPAWSCNMRMWLQIDSASYDLSKDLHFVYAYHPGEYICHLPGSGFPPAYYSLRLGTWFSDFDLEMYLNTNQINPHVLNLLDDELLADDPSIQSANVTIEPYGNWVLEIKLVEEGETFWMDLYGQWSMTPDANGFKCEGDALIEVHSINIRNNEGSVWVDLETLWTDGEIEMPAKVTIHMVYQTVDSGVAWGNILYNSNRSESMGVYTFP